MGWCKVLGGSATELPKAVRELGGLPLEQITLLDGKIDTTVSTVILARAHSVLALKKVRKVPVNLE